MESWKSLGHRLIALDVLGLQWGHDMSRGRGTCNAVTTTRANGELQWGHDVGVVEELDQLDRRGALGGFNGATTMSRGRGRERASVGAR